MMLFALLHELGHLFAGIMLKMKVKKMAIMPAGFSVEFSLKENDYNQKILNSNLLEVKKIIVALAGPITNILVIIIIKLINIQNNITYNIIYANCLIALFNLLPMCIKNIAPCSFASIFSLSFAVKEGYFFSNSSLVTKVISSGNVHLPNTG